MRQLSLFPSEDGSTDALKQADDVRRVLRGAIDLLGPRVPLPALFEDIARHHRGLPVESLRYRRLCELVGAISSLDHLLHVMKDEAEDEDVRLLAACVIAQMDGVALPIDWPDDLPRDGDDIEWILPALALFTRPGVESHYTKILDSLLRQQDTAKAASLPAPLLLIAFLHVLGSGIISDEQFEASVLTGGVMSLEVSAHRPLKSMHRLLDYLGLSRDPAVCERYMRLVENSWPEAHNDNWEEWRWIALPGGPDLFAYAVEAFAKGDRSLPCIHALKYAPLPPRDLLQKILSPCLPDALAFIYWLCPKVRKKYSWPLEIAEGLAWSVGANESAARVAYSAPPWWGDLCNGGIDALRSALSWLYCLEMPASSLSMTHDEWVEQFWVADLGRISVNMLMLEAAAGNGIPRICEAAANGSVPAIRALGCCADVGERVLEILYQQWHDGARPAQDAARMALDNLARMQGLPGAAELERQRVLSSAWEAGPLDGERVRVGWEAAGYRLRLALEAGHVTLETIGPHGALARPPDHVRKQAAYREARAAQHEVQKQYRLFRGHLEQAMLSGRCFPVGEFRFLLSNPIFAHLAERLIWRTAEGATFIWAGPDRWETLNGDQLELRDSNHGLGSIFLVHPVTLSRDCTLVDWQTLAADRRLTQPFQQIFREVYVELNGSDTRSDRFAGRRIDPQRAYALLRAAGFAPGNGVARRVWPGQLTAHLCWAHGARGRDLFGPYRQAEATMGEIWYTAGEEIVSFDQVDPIAISETLRTADFVSARASVGEAGMSSREMTAVRALLLREVARSYGLTNIVVPEDGVFALVLGSRATYRVSLTTGSVFLEPEGRQVIVPAMQSAWSPLEEDDGTAGIMATILSLAHDEQLTQTEFLSQVSPSDTF